MNDETQAESAPSTEAAPVATLPAQKAAAATYTDSNGDTHDAEVLAERNGVATLNISWSDGTFSQAAAVPLNPDGAPNSYRTNESKA